MVVLRNLPGSHVEFSMAFDRTQIEDLCRLLFAENSSTLLDQGIGDLHST